MRDSRQIVSRREIRMDGVQLVWLTLGAVVALGLMFALGTMVGRRSARLESPPTLDPVAQADSAQQQRPDLTFYDTLTSPKQAEPVAAAPATPAVPPVTAVAPVSAPVREQPNESGTSDVRDAINAGPARSGDYTIQVSAYQTRAEADAYVGALARKGFRAFVVEAELDGKGTWYRVRLGRYTTEAEAAQAKQVLAGADIPAWVIRSE